MATGLPNSSRLASLCPSMLKGQNPTPCQRSIFLEEIWVVFQGRNCRDPLDQFCSGSPELSGLTSSIPSSFRRLVTAASPSQFQKSISIISKSFTTYMCVTDMCVTDLRELLRFRAVFFSNCGCISHASQLNSQLLAPGMQIALTIFSALHLLTDIPLNIPRLSRQLIRLKAARQHRTD